MFKENFVVVIKNNGKILREDKNRVLLPFGSEYSILLKNLSSRKAVANISIDGTDVLNKKQIIINANSTVEVERFLGEDLNQGNKFKFIEKTQKISDYRGDTIDDGIVRVEYWFEKEYIINNNYYWDTCPASKGILRSNSGTWYQTNSELTCSSVNLDNFSGINNVSYSASSIDVKDGITVQGSVSNQQFTNGYVGLLEEKSQVITLMLSGFNQKKEVIDKPITVNEKIICKTCGTKNRSNNKFCYDCGTALI